MVRVVAVGRQDLLGCLEECIGSQSISLRKLWKDILGGRDNLVEESNIWLGEEGVSELPCVAKLWERQD